MHKVVIVNGTTDLLDLVEPVLTAGHYDVVFVESNARAYSHIRHERPALVILCLDMRDREGFRVLSMLKLDEDTRKIPLLTCLSEYELPSRDAALLEPEEDSGLIAAMPAVSMN